MNVFCKKLVRKNTMSILVLKKPLFSQIWGHFSVHKSEISKFLARIHMEYFHVAIFVISRVCLIRKYGSQSTAFFSVFHCFSGCRAPHFSLVLKMWMCLKKSRILWYFYNKERKRALKLFVIRIHLLL